MKGLKRWEEEDVVTDYVSNRALQLIQEIRGGALTEKLCKELRTHLDLALDNITNELSELRISIHETEKTSKKTRCCRRSPKRQKTVSVGIEKGETGTAACVERQVRKEIEVHIFADLFDITDENGKMRSKDGLAGLKKYDYRTGIRS